MKSNIFFKSLCRHVPSPRLSSAIFVGFSGLKSGVTKYFEPTALVCNCILQKVVDKVFQPFFTTKPTGQGNGLELSYDIIKVHSGEINLETNERQGSAFIIRLSVG